MGPPPELRYAEVAADLLLRFPMDARNQGLSKAVGTKPWVPVQGISLSSFPKPVSLKLLSRERHVELRPFDRQFVVDKSSGDITGLMFMFGGSLDDGIRKLDFDHPLNIGDEWVYVEVKIRNGSWAGGFEIVTAEDLPDPAYKWVPRGSLMKTGAKGNIHALLVNSEAGFWTSACFINYLVKDGTGWSAPLKLGKLGCGKFDTLAVGKGGDAFAAWENEEGRVVGLWIRPRTPGGDPAAARERYRVRTCGP